MLKGLDPILSPDLLFAIAAMGHGDEIAIVDANFPAQTIARRLIRLDGIGAKRVLEAVLSLLPLDDFIESPATVMQVVGNPDLVPEPVRDFQEILNHSEQASVAITSIDRFDFYERSRAAFAIVATGEARLCGNILLRKGIIRPVGGV